MPGDSMMAAMAIFVDDQPKDLVGESLGEVLAAASQALAEEGRVVVEVMLGDKVLRGDELGDHQNATITDTDVRLTSADPKALAISTLNQVREHLPNATALHEQAAECLQADNPAEALKHIAAAIEVWMQTQEAVLGSARVVGLGLDEVTVEGEPMTAFTDELIQQLHNLKELIGVQDTVALADALAYEWPAVVHRWDKLIQHLIEDIENMS